MWHNFRYHQETPVDHGRAFPETSSAMRPMLPVTLRSSIGEVRCTAMIDSGSDYCLFPLSLKAMLGLRIKDSMPVSGIIGFGSDGGQDVPFWLLTVGITSELSITTAVGFSEVLDDRGFGILGQLGFFSEVAEVRFDYKGGWFAIATADPVAGEIGA